MTAGNQPMTDQELQAWVERISMESFGLPFLHRARFNPRLRSTGGRYFTTTHHIEISSLYYQTYGAEDTEKVIKHELCHYHLHLTGRGYRHRDRDFKELLQQVGGTRYCKPPARKRRLPYRYLLRCQSCGLEYMRKRRLDPERYVCGRCRGRLKLYSLIEADTT